MYTQTIYAAGNSLAITIPKEIVRKFNLKRGHRVTITPADQNRLVVETTSIAKPVKKAASEKEFQTWLAQTLEEDSEILDELAKH